MYNILYRSKVRNKKHKTETNSSSKLTTRILYIVDHSRYYMYICTRKGTISNGRKS